MQVIFFSSSLTIIDEWKSTHEIEYSITCYDIETLNEAIKTSPEYMLVVDYDSVASELNKMLSSGLELKNTIVLEKSPEITTGKMLISKGVKAYGNTRMLSLHYYQMFEAVIENKVWTYPELTMALVQDTSTQSLNENSIALIQHRLSPKEIEVIYHILDGLTNDAIASKLDITTRTVKAHVSSIFSKLHVSDRISLVLLLK